MADREDVEQVEQKPAGITEGQPAARRVEDVVVPGGQRTSSPAALIADRMVRLHSKYLGRGPTKARTTLNTNVAVIVLWKTMTRAEQNLVAAGEADAVQSLRRTLKRSMREEAVAAVEDVLERRVTAYMSDIDTEANAASIVFTLEPLPETGTVEVAEAT
jgi:uncharacterized protein YbcI